MWLSRVGSLKPRETDGAVKLSSENSFKTVLWKGCHISIDCPWGVFSANLRYDLDDLHFSFK